MSEMRILGFQKHWSKLDNPSFTTFRYPRRDKDWQVGEVVQIVLHPRSKNKQYLGTARIAQKIVNHMESITDEDARFDGFLDALDMKRWLRETYGNDDRWVFAEPMNKLLLRWELRDDRPAE